MALQILSIHIFAALSPFCLESAVQLSIIGIENLRPSGSSLSGLPIRIGRIPGCPCSLSSALSTARFVCDVSRILHSGFRLIDCQIISAITVVLPVPGGPCIKAKSLARTDLATASICLSFGTGLDMQFFLMSSTASVMLTTVSPAYLGSNIKLCRFSFIGL